MQGEIKTFQHVLKARESTKETDDRHVTGGKYIPVMVNPHFRHCFKYESSDSDLDVPWARLISLLKESLSSSFWVKFHSKVEVGNSGPLLAGRAALLAKRFACRASSSCELYCMPGDPCGVFGHKAGDRPWCSTLLPLRTLQTCAQWCSLRGHNLLSRHSQSRVWGPMIRAKGQGVMVLYLRFL